MRVNRGQYMPATTRFLFFTTFVGSSSILPSSSFSLIPRLLIRKIPRNLNYSCCYYRNHYDCQQKHQNFIRRLHPYQHRRDNNIISPSLLFWIDRTEIDASAASSSSSSLFLTSSSTSSFSSRQFRSHQQMSNENDDDNTESGVHTDVI